MVSDTAESSANDIVYDTASTPSDPVIEEPLRPLFPDDPYAGLTTALRCGPMSLLPLGVSLMGLLGLRARGSGA